MSNESRQARNAAAATESNPDFAAPPPAQASTSSYNGGSKEGKDGEFDWRHRPTTAMQRFIMNRSDSSYSGMVGTGKVILREEGVRGLYRGLGPIILGYLPTWAVWFTVYGKSKEYFMEKKCKSNQMLLDE